MCFELFCVHVCFVNHMCAESVEARRRHWTLGNWMVLQTGVSRHGGARN